VVWVIIVIKLWELKVRLKLRQLYKSIKNNQIKFLSQIEKRMTDIQIDGESFFVKLQKINQTWKQVKLLYLRLSLTSTIFAEFQRHQRYLPRHGQSKRGSRTPPNLRLFVSTSSLQNCAAPAPSILWRTSGAVSLLYLTAWSDACYV